MPNGGSRWYGGYESYGTWREDTSRFMFLFRGKNYKVANLVCEAFHGPKPFPSAVCMHLNEDSRVNTPENLAWGTQAQNLQAPKYLEWARKRTKADIRKLRHMESTEIRISVNYGDVMAHVARDRGISACHVSNIMAGRIK